MKLKWFICQLILIAGQPYRVILFQDGKELRSLYVYIYIFCVVVS